MSQPQPTQKCRHTSFRQKCRSCQSLKRQWYQKLKSMGFSDIEYGLDYPRFTAQVPDPESPGAIEAREYYERVWQVYHLWVGKKRSARDCRVAELLALQSGATGTVRGISATLKLENLPPWSTSRVQITIKEIVEATLTVPAYSPSNPRLYLILRHARA